MTDSPENGTELTTNAPKNELFTVSGNLDVSDVLTVATSRAEAKLATRLAEAKRGLKEAEKVEKAAKDALNKAIETQSTEIANELAEKVEEGVEALGGAVERNTSDSLQQSGKGKVRVHASIKVHQSKASVGNRHGGYATTFERNDEPNEAVVEAQAAAETAAEARAAAQEHALETRRQLNNVPLLERQYRAKIAESKLQTSEEGKQLLEAMTETLDDDILALPSH
jgi:hypothetical protein